VTVTEWPAVAAGQQLTHISLEIDREDRGWLFIRLILRRAQADALSRDASIA